MNQQIVDPTWKISKNTIVRVERQEGESMKRMKNVLFPQKVAPVRLAGFRLFNVGGRVRWFLGLFKR